jgi:putative ABC transport system ATP-binding protein
MSEGASAEIAVLEGVSLRYPGVGDAPPVRALRKVSLRIRRGDRVAIRGESGSGKSTLLNVLGGLDAPTSGAVTVNGQDLTAMRDHQLAAYRARTVGFVFQTFQLLPVLTARENVELPMEALSIPRRERRQRAEELLESVGMSHRADHRPARMSGGEQQRVAIARALANRPSLLLADEPTGNLDRKSRGAVVAQLTRVNKELGTTLVIVTHDPNVADQCNLVHVIKRGKIVRQYSPHPSAAARALHEDEFEDGESEASRPDDEESSDDE